MNDFYEKALYNLSTTCPIFYKKGMIEYENRTINIRDCEKSVWIITRIGNQRIIKQVDEIFVKEVPIEKLIELHRKRIELDIDETGFEKELRSL